MNKTNIGWCDYTWNPVTGCKHGCRDKYCYATQKATSPLNRFGARYLFKGIIRANRDWRTHETGQCHTAQKGEIYPHGYDPTFYPHRLTEPARVKDPSRIFTVDFGDLFGRWVPKAWIDQVLNVAASCTWHDFQLLTKNPSRLSGFSYPDNCWAGTTVTSDKDYRRANIVKQVHARVRYLSLEPLMGPITFPLDGLQWLVVGGMTGKQSQLDPRWVQDIIREARKLRIPIYLKDNLAQYGIAPKIKQFPR